jgi:hypothetical protein
VEEEATAPEDDQAISGSSEAEEAIFDTFVTSQLPNGRGVPLETADNKGFHGMWPLIGYH